MPPYKYVVSLMPDFDPKIGAAAGPKHDTRSLLLLRATDPPIKPKALNGRAR